MKIQELLSSPDRWTQEAYARDKNEGLVFSKSPNAVKWCLLGAIFKCCLPQFYEIRDKVREATKIDIEEFNDSHTYEEVMELMRKLDL